MWRHLRERFNGISVRVLHPLIPSSIFVQVKRGLPEGSRPSPILFGIVAADLIRELQKEFPQTRALSTLRVFQGTLNPAALPLLALYGLGVSPMLMTSVYAPPIHSSCRPLSISRSGGPSDLDCKSTRRKPRSWLTMRTLGSQPSADCSPTRPGTVACTEPGGPEFEFRTQLVVSGR